VITTSPSELVLADDCSLARFYKYTCRLQPKESKRSPTLASGTAVSYVCEHFMLNYGGQVPPEEDIRALAAESLESEFAGDDDGGIKNVKRFLPGVCRAVSRVPESVWLAEWQVEETLEWTFEVGDGSEIMLRCRPDMFRHYTNDGIECVEIVDLKTTDYDPLHFMLWTPQLRMYALVLKRMYPNAQVSYRYLCIPTSASNKRSPHSPPFIFTARSMEKALEEVLHLVKKLDNKPEPRYSRRCEWCEFSKICMTRITGGDDEGYLQEHYQERPTREEMDKRKWEFA
jgi:CRISPR/Cas system-associated exonuclease Cas4 (RecB family)